jgi:anti-anti-sigma factor
MRQNYPCPCQTTVQLTVTGGNEALIQASGELDIATAERLDDALDAAALCSSSIHLDLEHVRFMDARTVEVLAQHDALCRKEGGRLHLHNTTGEPRKVQQLCGLDRLLTEPGVDRQS